MWINSRHTRTKKWEGGISTHTSIIITYHMDLRIKVWEILIIFSPFVPEKFISIIPLKKVFFLEIYPSLWKKQIIKTRFPLKIAVIVRWMWLFVGITQ